MVYFICTYCGNIVSSQEAPTPEHPGYESFEYVPYCLNNTERKLGRPLTETEREVLDHKHDPLVGMDSYLLGQPLAQHPSRARRAFNMNLRNFIYGPKNA